MPPNPSELLGSTAMAQLLEKLTGAYDFVIIDAPPLLPVTDAAVLSTIVDGALVVVGAGVAQREHVRRALESLEAVNGSVLGLILNRVKAKELGSGYGTYEYDYRPESERQRAKGGPASGAPAPRRIRRRGRRPSTPRPHAGHRSARRRARARTDAHQRHATESHAPAAERDRPQLPHGTTRFPAATRLPVTGRRPHPTARRGPRVQRHGALRPGVDPSDAAQRRRDDRAEEVLDPVERLARASAADRP